MNALRRAATAVQEVCEICAAPLAQEHGHLVDARDRRLLCACRPCYLLFVPAGAAQGRYRAVGDRYIVLDHLAFEGPNWDALQIPIGLAFFFVNGESNEVSAFYPGPGGATQSLLPLQAWSDLVREEPRLASLQPDVEAALVWRHRDRTAQVYLVPIDACYELTGIVRRYWQGFEGGREMRDRVDDFFLRVRERCR